MVNKNASPKRDVYITRVVKELENLLLNMIRRNGEIKISAFKSNRGGVSVTRCNQDTYEYAMRYMNSNFEGMMGEFPCSICDKHNVYAFHSPSEGHNLHHWELYGSEQKTDLSIEQILAIINSITIKLSD